MRQCAAPGFVCIGDGETSAGKALFACAVLFFRSVSPPGWLVGQAEAAVQIFDEIVGVLEADVQAH